MHSHMAAPDTKEELRVSWFCPSFSLRKFSNFLDTRPSFMRHSSYYTTNQSWFRWSAEILWTSNKKNPSSITLLNITLVWDFALIQELVSAYNQTYFYARSTSAPDFSPWAGSLSTDRLRHLTSPFNSHNYEVNRCTQNSRLPDLISIWGDRQNIQIKASSKNHSFSFKATLKIHLETDNRSKRVYYFAVTALYWHFFFWGKGCTCFMNTRGITGLDLQPKF